jgi:Tat protein translocase TatB subunit
MFGSIGFPELVLVFIVVLLVFGPKKLPEFARLLGKLVREFRSTVDQAKSAIQDEVYKEGMADHMKDISRDVKEALNITSDIGREVKDALDLGGVVRREFKDALDIYGGIDEKPATESEKKDGEKKG